MYPQFISFLKFLIRALGSNKIGRILYSLIVDDLINQKQSVTYANSSLQFYIPNRINKFRVDTFASKEPETLQWIDLLPVGSILWDIGANIGLYSCYAAKSRSCRVYSFEPSVFNVELLAKNIFLNGLSESITIIPFPLSDKVSENNLKMTNTDWGGALSTFGKSYGQDGEPIKNIFEFKTIGLSMDDAVTLLKLPQPDFVKIDVDGIEHLILKGGANVLKKVKGIIIEIDEKFIKQLDDSAKYLNDAGFTLKDKFNAENSPGNKFSNCFNQVWENQN